MNGPSQGNRGDKKWLSGLLREKNNEESQSMHEENNHCPLREAGHDSLRNKEQAGLHIAKDTQHIAKPTHLHLSGHQGAGKG